jgi:hypothetical protein
MPTFADDETDDLIDYISNKFRRDGGVVDWVELPDGTVITAVPDTDFDPKGWSDDPEMEKNVYKALEDGDVFGIIHWDREGDQIDSIWGMVGYGGAKKAIKAYIDDYLSPAPTGSTRAHSTQTPTVDPEYERMRDFFFPKRPGSHLMSLRSWRK